MRGRGKAGLHTAGREPRVLLANEIRVFDDTHDGGEVDRPTHISFEPVDRTQTKNVCVPLVKCLCEVRDDHNSLRTGMSDH